jgi:hypothetical protein
MKKSFCDKCGDEIKVDSEYVFGHELCPVCSGIIRDWLEGKTLELGCETEDKPIITDPECCGVCRGCKHSYGSRNEIDRMIIIGCLHYHKRIVQSYDIPYESITPEAFKTRGEDVILD